MNGSTEDLFREELVLPAFGDEIKDQYSRIEKEWDSLRQSACQTAAGRALWKHAVNDPLAEVLAGEAHLSSFHEKMRKDRENNASETSGVILAVRTLWLDSKLEAAVDSFSGGEAQVVLFGAGMDARAYRLTCLSRSDVFEVDFPDVCQVKHALIEAAMDSTNEHHRVKITEKYLTREATDIRDGDWLEKLILSGYSPERERAQCGFSKAYCITFHTPMLCKS